MGLYGGSAPKPDKRIGKAAELSAQLGIDYLDWTKERAKLTDGWAAEDRARYKNLYQPLEDRFIKQSDAFAKASEKYHAREIARADSFDRDAAADRQRYEAVFRPVEDKLVAEAVGYDTPGRQRIEAAKAAAAVRNEAAAADAAATRDLTSMGVAPGSGRFADLKRSTALRTGLAALGAGNTARDGVRERGFQMRGAVAQMGAALPERARVASATAAATRAGAEGFRTQALQVRANAANRGSAFVSNPLSSYTAGTQTVASGQSGAQAGLGQAMQGYGTMYNQQMAGYQASQQGSGALMEGLGTLAGFGLMQLPALASDEDAKTEKKPARGMLDAVRKMRVEGWQYKPDAPGGDGGGVDHVGTYAQDFQDATGKGDGKSIPVVDAIGVVMGGLKELDKKVERIGRGIRRPERRAA